MPFSSEEMRITSERMVISSEEIRIIGEIICQSSEETPFNGETILCFCKATESRLPTTKKPSEDARLPV